MQDCAVAFGVAQCTRQGSKPARPRLEGSVHESAATPEAAGAKKITASVVRATEADSSVRSFPTGFPVDWRMMMMRLLVLAFKSRFDSERYLLARLMGIGGGTSRCGCRRRERPPIGRDCIISVSAGSARLGILVALALAKRARNSSTSVEGSVVDDRRFIRSLKANFVSAEVSDLTSSVVAQARSIRRAWYGLSNGHPDGMGRRRARRLGSVGLDTPQDRQANA